MPSRSPEAIKASIAKRVARNRAIVEAEFAERGGHCVFEGCTRRKIEWHHRDPATKNESIASLVRGHTVKLLVAELALCDPYCRKHHITVDGRLERLIATRYTWKWKGRKDLKLTADDVCQIRSARQAGERAAVIAAKYGISESLVYLVVKRERYAWVT